MSEVGKALKLAVYRNMEPGTLNGFEHIGRCDLYESDFPSNTYTRISEQAEVTFHPLKDDTVIQNALRALDAAELKARENLQRALDAISDQRAQLQALTHKPQYDCERCKDTKIVTLHGTYMGDADDQPCPDCR